MKSLRNLIFLCIVLTGALGFSVDAASFSGRPLLSGELFGTAVSCDSFTFNYIRVGEPVSGIAKSADFRFSTILPPLIPYSAGIVSIVRPAQDTSVNSSPCIIVYMINGVQHDTLLNLSEGLNIFSIDTVIDGKRAFARRLLMLDLQPPEVAITAPVNGTVTNQQLAHVVWFVDGARQFKQLKETLAEGINIIVRGAFDAAGNFGSDTVLVTLDRLPPLVRIVYPFHDTDIYQIGIDVLYEVDSTPYSQYFALIPGSNTCIITGTDAAGNSASDTVIIRFHPLCAPVFTDIPSQTAQLGQQFRTLHLDNYLSHCSWDLSDLEFLTINGPNITSAVADLAVSFQVVNATWYGKDTIKIIAIDPDNLADTAIIALERKNTLTLTCVVRDFKENNTIDTVNNHPDFQPPQSGCDGKDNVQRRIAVTGTDADDRNPVLYQGVSDCYMTRFGEWYTTNPDTNVNRPFGVNLKFVDGGNGLIKYINSSFFPIDNDSAFTPLGKSTKTFGHLQSSYPQHNYGFTMELHAQFQYHQGTGQVFKFTGDDDVWVFINDSLVIDLGGIHSAQSDSVKLDLLPPGFLVDGKIYPLDFFSAERHTTASNIMITTSLALINTPSQIAFDKDIYAVTDTQAQITLIDKSETAQIETRRVEVTSTTGDTLVRDMRETGITSGRFVDRIKMQLAAANRSDTLLQIASPSLIRARYINFDYGDTASASATVGSQNVVVIESPADSALVNHSPVTVVWTVNGMQQTTQTQEYLVNGVNKIVRSVTDPGGTSSDTVTVFYDPVPPVIVISNPHEGYITNSFTIPVAWTVDGIPQTTGLFENLTHEGSNTIVRFAYDAAGNRGADTVHVIRDTIKPNVVITSPANGSFTGNPIIPVSWTVDGIVQTTQLTQNLTEGQNTITRSAIDAAGNTGTASVTVTLDTQAPVVVITSPVNGLLTNQPDQTIIWTVDGVQYTKDTILTEGENIVIRTATDEAGNTGADTITVILDTRAPVVAITSPPNGYLTNQTPVAIVWTVDGIVQTVQVTENLVEGANAVIRSATDNAGNTGTDTITVTLDAQAPVVAITSPVNWYLTNHTPVDVSWTVDGIDQTTQVTEDLIEGDNTITRFATDPAGNTGTASITVTLDTQAPVVVITAPGDSAVTYNPAVHITWTIDGVPYQSDTLLIVGTHGICRTATDAAGNTGRDSVTIFVRANNAPVIEPVADILIMTGQTREITINATDPENDSLVFSTQGLPGFATFTDNHDNTSSLFLVPQANDTGVFSIKVTVSDGLLNVADTFSVAVVLYSNWAFDAVSLLNMGIVPPGTREAIGPAVSVLNNAMPILDTGDVTGPAVSVLNQAIPVGETGEAIGPAVSVLNNSTPDQNFAYSVVSVNNIFGTIDLTVPLVDAAGLQFDTLDSTFYGTISVHLKNIGSSYIDTLFTPFETAIFLDRNHDNRYTEESDTLLEAITITNELINVKEVVYSVLINLPLSALGTEGRIAAFADIDNAIEEPNEDNNYGLTGILSGYTFSSGGDFCNGDCNNLSDSGGLHLSDTVKQFNYIWVAVSSKGTVVKIDTRTGQVLGEYWTSPSGQPKDPSRTTVDLNGSVWVANRAGNSVLKIGLIENNQCIDKNHDGIITTSTGRGNILPWSNTNGEDTQGGVSTAEDECICQYVRTTSSGTRHVSVDPKTNNVWVSGYNGRQFDLIESQTGSIIRTEPSVGYGGYGGLMDKNGVIWSAMRLLRWDPVKPLTGPNGVNWKGYEHQSYGLGIDSKGNVWNTSYGADGLIRKFSPAGDLIGSYSQGNVGAQGCAADKNDHIWVANSLSGPNRVSHLLNDGTFIGYVTVGGNPTGVAVDADGKIWSTNYDQGTVSRIDPLAGPIGADGKTPVGAVDFTSVNLGGILYNYSDMTGSTLTGKVFEGTWTTVVHIEDSAAVITWSATICSDGILQVKVATSSNGIDFGSFIEITNGEHISLGSNRYIKLQVFFKRSSDGISPILHNLTINANRIPAPIPQNQPPIAQAGSNQVLVIGDSALVSGEFCDDGLPVGSTLTTLWRQFEGPPATIAHQDSCVTRIYFPSEGYYRFSFEVFDGELTGYDTMDIAITPPTTIVPKLVGKTRAEAETALSAANLVPGIITEANDTVVPVGIVISQNPDSGFGALEGSSVNFTVSLGRFNHAPVLASIHDTSTFAGGTFIISFQYYDQDNDPLTLSLPVAPPFAALVDSGNGWASITFATSEADSGRYPVTIRAIDWKDTTEEEFVFWVLPADNPPHITSTPVWTAVVGTQYVYNVTATDEDNDDLKFMLTESPGGMTIDSITGQITWMPLTYPSATHQVTVCAFDGWIAGCQQYSITVNDTANQAPRITSTPVTSICFEQDYAYQVLANDPDADPLNYSLTQAPSGMTISPAGLVVWPKEAPRTSPADVTVEVNDGNGGIVTQSWTIIIAPDTIAPVTRIEFSANPVQPGILVTVTVIATDNIAVTGATLLQDSTAQTLDENYSYTFTPSAEDTIRFDASASDAQANNGHATALLYVNNVADNTQPLVDISYTPANPQVGDMVTFTVTASDNMALDNERVWLSVDGQYLDLDQSLQTQWPALRRGVFTAQAVAYDLSGNSAQATKSVNVYLSGTDGTYPVVEFLFPPEDTTVYEKISLLGTATDENFAYYTLACRRNGTTPFIEFYRSTQTILNGTLGWFDATNMENGDYVIRLTGFDKYGNYNYTELGIRTDGQAKLGNFTLAFSDLKTSANGIQLEVVRSYDSRNKLKGDFGTGWRVDVQSIKLNEPRPAGEAWRIYDAGGTYYSYGGYTVYIPNYQSEERKKHAVSITIPGGRKQEFDIAVNFYNKFDNNYGYISFKPASGTYSKLESLEDVQFFRSGDNLYAFDMSGYLNIDRYKLTLLDGSYYIFDQNAGGIVEMGDPNGNIVTINNNGITHSDGESISFIRDAQQRITSINSTDGRNVSYTYDCIGNLATVTDPNGNLTRFKYGTNSYLMEIIDPRGVRATRTEYDDQGRMVRQINAEGDTLAFNHDIDNRTETITDFAGNTTSFSYDTRGNVLSKADNDNNTWSYTYDQYDNQTSETFPGGATKSATFDSLGNKLTETDELDHTTTWAYNSKGKITSKTDPLDRTTTYTYDSKGNMLREIGPGNIIVSAQGLDAYGNVLTDTNALGYVTRHTYAGGLVASTTDPLGRISRWTYDKSGNVLTNTDAKGLIARFTYDANGNKLTEKDALNNIKTYEYTSFNKVAKETDARGNVTVYEYDIFGQLKKTIAPDSAIIQQQYDVNGNLARAIDPAGRVTDMEYDPENRLTKTTNNDGSFTTLEYDARGWRTAMTDANGNRTEYEYDSTGNNTVVRDALGNETRYEYDAAGNQTAIIAALNHRTESAYDQYNRLVRTTFNDATYKEITYNDLGQKIAETDQEGNVSQFGYDPAGNLTSVTDAMGHVTAYTYDNNNNRISQTDANTHTTAMDYDNQNRLFTRTYPNGDQERFGYDENSNQMYKVSGTDSTVFEFDSRNREVYRKYFNSGHEVVTKYTVDGRMDTVVDYRGITSYEWGDCCGKLLKETNPDGTFIEYEYDINKNKTAMITPWGRTEYTYDDLNRMDSVIAPDGGVTQYFYNAVGNRDSIYNVNGTSVRYEYDPLNRLTQVTNYGPTGAVISSYAYELNNAGIRTAVVEVDGSRVDYVYDDLYRLTSEIRTGTHAYTISFAYNNVGNRLTQVKNGVSTSYTYNNRDQLITENTGVSTISYSYDPAGRMITKTDASGTTTYSWIDSDRMSSVVTPTQTISYEYNADGIKIKTDDGTSTKWYLYDMHLPYGQVIAEYGNDGSLIVGYVYGHERISQKRGTVVHFYIADGQGSIRQLTDVYGAVTDEYLYTAFGETLARTGSTINEFQYVGEQWDPNVGFYYLRARWYNPENGRFASVDPWEGDPQAPMSLHRYLYGNASPAVFRDPTGKSIAAIMGIIALLYVTNAQTIPIMPAGQDCKHCLKSFMGFFSWGWLDPSTLFADFEMRLNKASISCVLVQFKKGDIKDIETGKYGTVIQFGKEVEANFPNWTIDQRAFTALYPMSSRDNINWYAYDSPSTGPGYQRRMSFFTGVFDRRDASRFTMNTGESAMNKAIRSIIWTANVTHYKDGKVTYP